MAWFPDLTAQVVAAQRSLDREVGEARAVAAAGVRAVEAVRDLTAQSELHQKVSVLLTSVGEQAQQRAQTQIEELVTRGLQVIFDESLSFHLVQAVRGSQATVDFVIRSATPSGVVETPVLEARGGGMAAVVGFLLRLVVLLLTPGARRFLALDESFGMVSAEYEPRVAEFLREVCDKAGVQVLLVTHSDAYSDVADQHYRFMLHSSSQTVVSDA